VRHLDSWIKTGQLGVTFFIISLFNAQHVSDVNTSILRSLRHICWVVSWVVLFWFDVCWCYGVVWLWWCGVVSVCRLKHYHTTPAKPQRNTSNHSNTNHKKNSTYKSQASGDGCINIRNLFSIKQWNNKASAIKLVSLYSTITFNLFVFLKFLGFL